MILGRMGHPTQGSQGRRKEEIHTLLDLKVDLKEEPRWQGGFKSGFRVCSFELI